MFDSTHQVYGVRYHHEQISVGDTCPQSYCSVDDGSREELGGTSAIDLHWDGVDHDSIDAAIAEVQMHRRDGGCVVLIGGNFFDYGADEGEVIISGAVVLARF